MGCYYTYNGQHYTEDEIRNLIKSGKIGLDYKQLSDEEVLAYSSQIQGKTKAQKDTAETLLSLQTQATLTAEHKYFVGSDELKSTTETLKANPFYQFHGDQENEEKYEINRQWGNVIDKVLTGIVLGKTYQEIYDSVDRSIISDTALEKVYQEMVKIRTEHADSILLSQIILFNKQKGIAGSLDLVIVKPDGRIKIVDLKSSVKSFTETYTSESGYDNSYKKRFRMGGQEYASRFDRHEAQLSIYAALAESKGLKLDDNPLAVLPMKLEVAGNIIQDVKRERDYIPAGYIKRFQDLYSNDFVEAQKQPFQEILDKLKVVIQEKIQLFKKENKNTYFLESLLAQLSDKVNLEAVNRFIDEAHDSFMGKGSWKGWANHYDSLFLRNYDDMADLMQDLREVEAQIELYLPSSGFSPLEQLRFEYERYKDENGLTSEPGSAMDKLIKVTDEMKKIRQDFGQRVPRIIAEILSKQITDNTIQEIKKNIEAKEKKIKDYKARNKDTSNLEKQVRDLKEKYKIDSKGDPDIKAMIEHEIRVGGYKDISNIDRWFTPAVSIDNSFLPTFALTIKQAFEKVRQQAREFIFEAYKQFDEYAKYNKASKDNPAEFNKGLYKTRQISYQDENKEWKTKNILVLTSPIDYDAYNKAKAAMYQKIEKIKDIKEYEAEKRLWYAQNTQGRPAKDLIVNGVTLIEGMETIIARKKEQLPEKLFNRWLNEQRFEKDGEIIYVGELSIPKLDKYRDKDFDELIKDKRKLDYYTFLVKTYFDSQAKHQGLNRREEDRYILPFVSKSSNDRIRENGLVNYAKRGMKDMFTLLDEDENEYNLEDTRTIPILYYNKAHKMDASDVSTDLLHSILKFKVASLRFVEQNRYSALADNLLTLVKGTEPALTDAAGFKILSRAAKAIGLQNGVDEYAKKHGSNNVAALLEAFIDIQIYGKTRKDDRVSVLGKTIDLGKVADTIINFGSMTQIGLDASLAVANSLQANAMALTEAHVGKYFTKAEWADALRAYETYELDFIKDSMRPFRQSLIGQLTDLYEPMQGDYLDEYGHKLTKSALKAKWRQASFFAGMRKGEHHIQVSMMIAMLKKKKVQIIKDGIRQEISLLDAYELDSEGKIKLREGVNIPLVDQNTQRQIHAISKRLHGVYNSFDAPIVQRHWWGRLIMMYRKFLVPGWKKRWKAEGFDYELDTFTEGTYRVFYKELLNDTKNLLSALVGGQHTYSEYELANIKRAAAEHLIVATTGIIILVLTQLVAGADDDKKPILAWNLYFAMRLNRELSLYGAFFDPSNYFIPNLKEMGTTYKSVSAGAGILDKVIKVYTQGAEDITRFMFTGDIERYERDAGFFKAGDSKFEASVYKLLGINPRKILADPESAVDMLILQNNR